MIKQLNSEAEKDYYKMLQAEILLKKQFSENYINMFRNNES